ncbi:hypothetical protein T4A_1877 [Trichinella pseudospiralis]|uniref:Uncharacterized protein n=1 Tax=Trichinella pseudospiralis TaxID=6337 RepID=A0A0V1EHQ1_TRIPS|nr:hypothetical protein T4A_1877 [Trichinella pseudospiralis]
MELPLAEHRHYIHVGSKYIFPPFMIPYLNLYALLSYTMDVAPQRLVYKRYCSAKQLIKANQVQRENLEVHRNISLILVTLFSKNVSSLE